MEIRSSLSFFLNFLGERRITHQSFFFFQHSSFKNDEGKEKKIKGKKNQINIKKDPAIKMGIICSSANAEKIMDFRIDRLFKEIKPELEARILENIGAN